MEIKINGLESLLSKFQNIKNCSAAVELGLMKGGKRIEDTAKMLCPARTGYLRGSIHTEKRGPMTVCVFTKTEYAAPVEYGTGALGDPAVAHTTKTHWSYQDVEGNWHTCHGTKPQPFFQPAFEQQKDFVAEAVQQEVRKSAGIGGNNG